MVSRAELWNAGCDQSVSPRHKTVYLASASRGAPSQWLFRLFSQMHYGQTLTALDLKYREGAVLVTRNDHKPLTFVITLVLPVNGDHEATGRAALVCVTI